MASTPIVISGGLPAEAHGILSKALVMAYGEGVVSLEDHDLSVDLEMSCISAETDPAVLFVILSQSAETYIDNGYPAIHDSPKLYVYNGNLSEFVDWLNDSLGIELPKVEIQVSESGDTSEVGTLKYQNHQLDEQLKVLKEKLESTERVLGSTKDALRASEERFLNHISSSQELETSASPEYPVVSLDASAPGIIPDLQVISAANPASEDSLRHYIPEVLEGNSAALVVDLMAPTYCDYLFRLRDVVSCGGWLKEEQPLNDVIMKSVKYKIDVVSLGFERYSFDWLISLDWFHLLSGLGRPVVILVGALSSDDNLELFTKLSSLSSLTSMIISRGSPISLRNSSFTLKPIQFTTKLVIVGSGGNSLYTKFNFPPAMIFEEVGDEP